MNFQKVFHVLLGAIFAITSVQASPYFGGLRPRDASIQTVCTNLTLGGTVEGTGIPTVGRVCLNISAGTAAVTYPTLTAPDAYTDIHVYIGTAPPTDHVASNFLYTLGNGKCIISDAGTKATCSMPVDSSWRQCDSLLYLATHAEVSYAGQSQTGWGSGHCFDSPDPANCANYWTVRIRCQCPVVTTYEAITSTRACLTTITNIITSIVTPPPLTTTTACNDPQSATGTPTVAGTTSTLFAVTCPTATMNT